MSEIQEAIRFAEEYGYNRWQQANAEWVALRRELAECRSALDSHIAVEASLLDRLVEFDPSTKGTPEQ